MITAGHGADLICDSVGKAVQSGNMRSIANFGRIVVFGYASGEPKYDMAVLLGAARSLDLRAVPPRAGEPDHAPRDPRHAAGGVNGELKLPLGGVLPLNECAEAHRRLEARETMGKLLLEVDGTLDTRRG